MNQLIPIDKIHIGDRAQYFTPSGQGGYNFTQLYCRCGEPFDGRHETPQRPGEPDCWLGCHNCGVSFLNDRAWEVIDVALGELLGVLGG